MAWTLLIAALAAAGAEITPPPGLGLEGLVRHDPNLVELRDFKAKLLLDNLQSLREGVQMFDGAAKGARAGVVTYMWDPDLAGRATAHAAILAARRGVETVVIVDATDLNRIDGRSLERRRMFNAMAREGVKFYVFRPFRVAPLQFNRRLHEKATYVELPDGRVMFLCGGRNKGNHFLLGTDVFDVDVRITVDRATGERLYRQQFTSLIRHSGTVPWDPTKFLGKAYDHADHLVEMQKMREAYEFSKYLFTLDKRKRHVGLPEVDVRWGLFARNRGRRKSISHAVEALVGTARRFVVLANAYFVPVKKFHRLLQRKLDEKVPVALFSNTDHSMKKPGVYALMTETVASLLPRGLSLSLRKEGELHAKTTAVDHRVLVVGSANLDPRSEELSTENGLILDSREITIQFEDALAVQSVRGEYHVVNRLAWFRPWEWCAQLLLRPLRGLF